MLSENTHGWDAMLSYRKKLGFWVAYDAVTLEFSYLPHTTLQNQNILIYLGIGGGVGWKPSSLKAHNFFPSLFLKPGIQFNIHGKVSPYINFKTGLPELLSIEYGVGF